MYLENIKQIIKERREVLNITQNSLAELSGVSLRTIKEIEGSKGNPTIETIEKIADVLGMEITLQVKQPKH